MKTNFLLIAALVVASLAQNIQPQPSLVHPTVNLRDKDTIEGKKLIETNEVQVLNHPLLGKEEFNNNQVIGNHPLLGK